MRSARAFGLEDPGDEFDVVVEPAVLGDVVEAPTGARLEVRCAVDDPMEPGEHRGAGAHDAWLERHHQRVALRDAPGAVLGDAGQQE